MARLIRCDKCGREIIRSYGFIRLYKNTILGDTFGTEKELCEKCFQKISKNLFIEMENKNMNRKFEYVDRIISNGVETLTPKFELPKRSTANSAGYDFICPERVEIPPYKLGDNPVLVKTGVKAYMQNDEVLMLYNRSSNPKKKKLVIPNSVGVIDADYYGNADNDGEIGFTFYNLSNEVVVIEKGEKLRTRCISKIFNN